VRPGERVNFVGYVRRRKSNELECQITALKGAEEKVLSGSVIIRCKSACKDFEE
jgi:ligand-binding sensor protein